MIKNVIFDLDGTLLDTTEGILESVKFTVKELGFPELPHKEILNFIGPPIQISFKKYYECNEEKAQAAANLFRNYYKDVSLLKAKPYEGVYELCEYLKENQIKMAVATYKREDYALSLLKHFHFDKYCCSMHAADNNNFLKKEDIVQLCIKEMGGSTADSVMIGDTIHDAMGAVQAGIPFIAVTYGFGFNTEKDVERYPHIGIANKLFDIGRIVINSESCFE